MHIYLYIYQCLTCLVCPRAYGCDIAQQSFAQDANSKHQSLPIPPWLEQVSTLHFENLPQPWALPPL